MTKRITFLIASNAGTSIKQTSVSKGFLVSLSLTFAISFWVLGFIVYDYFKIKGNFFHTHLIENKMLSQQNEIVDQRKQIQLFANEINSLKGQLVNLNNFEKKIRIIANIEKTTEQNNIFGVGGSIPEDLDANISMKNQHNSLLREMHEQIDDLSLATEKQKEGLEALLSNLEDQRSLLASTPAVFPTLGWITSRFGYRTSPFTGRREFHKGLDIATRKGTPVIAPADGVVTFGGDKGLLGTSVVLDHSHGVATRYGHLLKTLKNPGDRVKRGDKIGEVGSSGRSTGPHLHYEVSINGVQVNPEKYIID